MMVHMIPTSQRLHRALFSDYKNKNSMPLSRTHEPQSDNAFTISGRHHPDDTKKGAAKRRSHAR